MIPKTATHLWHKLSSLSTNNLSVDAHTFLTLRVGQEDLDLCSSLFNLEISMCYRRGRELERKGLFRVHNKGINATYHPWIDVKPSYNRSMDVNGKRGQTFVMLVVSMIFGVPRLLSALHLSSCQARLLAAEVRNAVFIDLFQPDAFRSKKFESVV